MVTDDSAQPTRVRYGVLAFVCSLSMITYLDRVCFGAAAPFMAAELGLGGVAELKWAFVAFAIAYGIFEVPAGWLGDRWGPRGTLIRIVAWWSAFTALTGLIGLRLGPLTLGGVGSLIALRFLFGAGEAGAYPNIARVVHNWFPPQRWETAQGMVWMSGRLAGGLTPLVWAVLVGGTSWTPPLVGWRGAFGVFGLMGLIWCVAFAATFRNRPAEHPSVNRAEIDLIGEREESVGHPHSVPWRQLLTNRSLLALCAMYSLINYGWYFNITYLPGYLKDRFQIAEADLWGAIYKGAPLWVGAAGCLLGGVLISAASNALGSRTLARQVVCVPALLMCAICWWSARFAPSIHAFCILISLAAFGIDLTLGAAWASCQDIGGKHTAVVAACMNMIGTFGSAVAGWVTGTIVESVIGRQASAMGTTVEILSLPARRSATIAGFDTVFASYALVYVVAAACWLLIRPRSSDDLIRAQRSVSAAEVRLPEPPLEG